MSSDIRKKAVLLGEHRSLVGVLSLPREVPTDIWPVAAIILNSGVIHRVGVNRLHVELSQVLAARGIPTLTFDLSAVGDSPSRPGHHAMEECIDMDVDDAVKYANEVVGAAGVVLLGLCSGANNSFRVARKDPRVVGLVLLDPPAYRTWGFYWRDYLKRARKIRGTTGLLRKLIAEGRAVASSVRGRGGSTEEFFIPPGPTKAVARQGLSELVSRGVKMLLVFSGGLDWNYNYKGQFLDCFHDLDFRDKLTLEYFPASNHTFSKLRERRRVVETIRSWLVKQWIEDGKER